MRLKVLRANMTTAAFVLLGWAAPMNAQSLNCWAHWETLGGPYQDVQRSLDLTLPSNNTAVRRGGQSLLKGCEDAATDSSSDARYGIRLVMLPATALMQFNSGYPRTGQDGLRWAGRGLSAATTTGAGASWKWFSAVLAPAVSYQQNQPFEIEPITTAGLSPYGNFYHAGTIDQPQRFGDKPFWWYSLGQSFVRIDAFGAAAGLSTENLRWGPAHRNPLLMGGAAPGFPHAFIGTSHPVDVGLGYLEIEAVWGRLTESAYFDFTTDNDSQLFGGLVMAFSPRGSGLTLGFARSYLSYVPPNSNLIDQIVAPYRRIGRNEADNELLSGFLYWVLPESGFRVYGEFARDDAWEDMRDLVLEPDHSRAYTVGLEKVFARDNAPGMLRIAAEATNVGRSPTYQSGRGQVSFYTHSEMRQGYTHRGQLLGAPIGTGSDAQYVSADYLGRNLLAGVYLERVRYDNDVYYDRYADRYTYAGHDAELSVGIRSGGVFHGVQLVGEFARSSRHNRGFLGLRDGIGFTHETNFSVSLGASWAPRGRNGH